MCKTKNVLTIHAYSIKQSSDMDKQQWSRKNIEIACEADKNTYFSLSFVPVLGMGSVAWLVAVFPFPLFPFSLLPIFAYPTFSEKPSKRFLGFSHQLHWNSSASCCIGHTSQALLGLWSTRIPSCGMAPSVLQSRPCWNKDLPWCSCKPVCDLFFI